MQRLSPVLIRTLSPLPQIVVLKWEQHPHCLEDLFSQTAGPHPQSFLISRSELDPQIYISFILAAPCGLWDLSSPTRD